MLLIEATTIQQSTLTLYRSKRNRKKKLNLPRSFRIHANIHLNESTLDRERERERAARGEGEWAKEAGERDESREEYGQKRNNDKIKAIVIRRCVDQIDPIFYGLAISQLADSNARTHTNAVTWAHTHGLYMPQFVHIGRCVSGHAKSIVPKVCVCVFFQLHCSVWRMDWFENSLFNTIWSH